MQSAKPSPSSVPTLQSPTNIKAKNWLGANLYRISLSYLGIIAIGLTTFYFAKQEIDLERLKQMKIKQEIHRPVKHYPNRLELIKAEKEREKELLAKN